MPPMLRPLRSAGLLAAIAALGCGRGDISSPDPTLRARAVRSLVAREDAPVAVLLVAERDPSPLVRLAAAEAFASRGGPGAADALGELLVDRDGGVAAAAARGLAAMPKEPRARERLTAAYVDATPGGRAAIAEALDRLGVSLREAVEREARTRWERNVAALEGGRGAARAGAAEEIGASARADAVQRLVPLADPNRNPDPVLCAAAARGLGESGEWSARPHLESLLLGSDAHLAEIAAAALGRLGDPAASDSLAGAATAQEGRLAGAAVEALAALPDAPEVGIALCELAIRARDPAVAARAARAARSREAECPVRPLLAKLGRPGEEAALAALADLRLTPEGASAAVERIVPMLEPGRSPDPAIRVAAARALGRLGIPAAAAPLTRRAAAVAGRVGAGRSRWIPGPLPASAPPEWIDAVSRADTRDLGALLAASGRLRAGSAEALLLPFARDPSPDVRAGAVEGLAALGTGAGLEAAGRALDDPDSAVRMAAAGALPRFGTRAAAVLGRVADAAPPSSPEWRIALAHALGETGSIEAVPALAHLLEGASSAEAAAALARIGAPAAAPPLVAHLARPDAPGLADTLEALAQLVARDAGPGIAGLLTDDRPEVRASAARAIGRLGYEGASQRLEALRSDYYGRVRRAAVEALAKLPAGGPRPRP